MPQVCMLGIKAKPPKKRQNLGENWEEFDQFIEFSDDEKGHNSQKYTKYPPPLL